jgi:four helix bundle protein
MSRIQSHEDLDVYRIAFAASNRIFEESKAFPNEEAHSLTQDIRGCSRLVCTKIAEAWRRRRSIETFVDGLSEAEANAGQTQSWISIANQCGYIPDETAESLIREYDHVLGKLVRLIASPEPWIIRKRK